MSKDYKIKEDNQGGLFEDKEILTEHEKEWQGMPEFKQDKLYYLNSDCSHWDDYFYCKECFRKLFKMLPEKVKLTFSGYKGKDKKDVS